MKNNRNLLMRMKKLERFGRKSIKKCAAVAMASMLFATTGFSLAIQPVKAQEVNAFSGDNDVVISSENKIEVQKQVRMLLKSMKRFLE